MLYFPKIGDYSKILTDDKLKDSVVINFFEYFKPMKEKLCSKLSKKQNIRKTVESLFIFLTTLNEIKKYVEVMELSSSDNCVCHFTINILNIFYLELQLINSKPIIKNKLKELLSELKQFKVLPIYSIRKEMIVKPSIRIPN